MLTAEAFLAELQRIILSRPKRPITILRSQNCAFGSYVYDSKGLYYAFDCSQCEDSFYMYDSFGSRNSMDCDFAVNSELCYESVDIFKCYNSKYLRRCENLVDSAYSYDCSNCNYVFGCVGLKNRSYCIFNRQLDEASYKAWRDYYDKQPRETILAALETIMTYYPLTQTNELHNQNSPYGNNTSFCKNCYMCFDARNDEDCGHLYDSQNHKMCYDSTQSARSELCYEMTDSGDSFNCNYTVFSAKCVNTWYAIDCYNLKDSLGCFYLNNKQYCILNRQFTKEDYERISKPLIEDLARKNLGWGNLTF